MPKVRVKQSQRLDRGQRFPDAFAAGAACVSELPCVGFNVNWETTSPSLLRAVRAGESHPPLQRGGGQSTCQVTPLPTHERDTVSGQRAPGRGRSGQERGVQTQAPASLTPTSSDSSGNDSAVKVGESVRSCVGWWEGMKPPGGLLRSFTLWC